MNALDISFIVVLIIFLAVGARLGSIWTTASLAAGFVGATVVDLYALQLADMMGSFAGVEWLAIALLYVGTAGIILGVGWFISSVSSVIFLGIIDSTCGLITGAFAGLLFTALLLLTLIPTFPSIEKKSSWKKSNILRPFENFIDQKIDHSPFKIRFAKRKLKPNLDQITESAEKVAVSAQKKSKELVRDLTK